MYGYGINKSMEFVQYFYSIPFTKGGTRRIRGGVHYIGQWRMDQEMSSQEPRPIADHKGRREGEPKLTDKSDTVGK